MKTERNNVSRMPRSRCSPATFWRVYDTLPREIRAALQEGVSNWTPTALARAYAALLKRGIPPREAVEHVVDSIWVADADDVFTFGRGYKKEHRSTTPHIAAGATIQRYGSRA